MKVLLQVDVQKDNLIREFFSHRMKSLKLRAVSLAEQKPRGSWNIRHIDPKFALAQDVPCSISELLRNALLTRVCREYSVRSKYKQIFICFEAKQQVLFDCFVSKQNSGFYMRKELKRKWIFIIFLLQSEYFETKWSEYFQKKVLIEALDLWKPKKYTETCKYEANKIHIRLYSFQSE